MTKQERTNHNKNVIMLEYDNIFDEIDKIIEQYNNHEITKDVLCEKQHEQQEKLYLLNRISDSIIL